MIRGGPNEHPQESAFDAVAPGGYASRRLLKAVFPMPARIYGGTPKVVADGSSVSLRMAPPDRQARRQEERRSAETASRVLKRAGLSRLPNLLDAMSASRPTK